MRPDGTYAMNSVKYGMLTTYKTKNTFGLNDAINTNIKRNRKALNER
jgi:hypothetical protein